MSTMDHVRYLAETIGPRGSTTPKEAEAARYAVEVLRRAGLEPVTESYLGARSAWYPYALFSGLALLSAFLLAERLKGQPLAHTAVWAVLSGCEEVGCYGAEAFAQAHRTELERAAWIAVDSVGGIGAGPAYLTHETFLLTTRSDPILLALAEDVAARHPELDVYAHSFQGAYTEGAIGAKHGFRVLTLVGHRRDGVLPEWHRPTDVVAKWIRRWSSVPRRSCGNCCKR